MDQRQNQNPANNSAVPVASGTVGFDMRGCRSRAGKEPDERDQFLQGLNKPDNSNKMDFICSGLRSFRELMRHRKTNFNVTQSMKKVTPVGPAVEAEEDGSDREEFLDAEDQGELEVSLEKGKIDDDDERFQRADQVFKDYRSVDCAICERHVALQCRADPLVNFCSSDCLCCRLYHTDDFQSGIHELVDDSVELCHDPDEVTSMPLTEAADDVPRWFFKDLKLSDSLYDGASCIVTFVWGPNHLSLMAEHDFKLSEALSEKILLHCMSEFDIGWLVPFSAPQLSRLPAEGELVLAPYEDGDFYRGVVQQVIKPSQDLLVFFIDFGDEARVSINSCKEISRELVEDYPVLTVEFIAEGLPANQTVPEIVCIKLKEASNLYTVEPRVNSVSDSNVWSGVLWLQETNTHWISLVDNLVQQSSTAEGDLSVLKYPWQRFYDQMPFSPNLHDRATVRIGYMWNNSTLTLNADVDSERLDALGMAITRHVDAGQRQVKTENARGCFFVKPTSRVVAAGEVILAPYTDQVTYRAVVKSTGCNLVEVEFIDYGDRLRLIPREKLRELSDSINEHPIYGLTWTMPGIPKEAAQLNIPELVQFCEDDILAQLEIETFNKNLCTGKLWISADLTWNQVVLDELTAAGMPVPVVRRKSVNPWSSEIAERLLQHLLTPFESVDHALTRLCGPNYLVYFSQRTFPKTLTSIQHHQQSLLMKLDQAVERPWSDLLEDFYYDASSIPIVQIPVGTRVHVKITCFNDVHSWSGYIIDEPWCSYRQRLCTMLNTFCHSRMPPSEDFRIQEDVVCLFKMPSWKEIDRLMTKCLGKSGWTRVRARPWRRTNKKTEDGEQAGNWYRGIVEAPVDNDGYGYECFTVWCPDVCRSVPVHQNFILPAVYRFVGIPSLGVSGALVLQHFDGLTDEERKNKWYEFFPRGTIIPCTVVGHDGGTTIFKMPSDVESNLNKQYEEMKKQPRRRSRKQTKRHT